MIYELLFFVCDYKKVVIVFSEFGNWINYITNYSDSWVVPNTICNWYCNRFNRFLITNYQNYLSVSVSDSLFIWWLSVSSPEFVASSLSKRLKLRRMPRSSAGPDTGSSRHDWMKKSLGLPARFGQFALLKSVKISSSRTLSPSFVVR